MVDHCTGSLAFAFLLLFLKFQLAFLQQTERISLVERDALLQLRSSLGIRSREWPRKANPCLNWRGVSCFNGSVSGINISGFRRTRIGARNPQFSVDSLANLTRLRSFNASRFLLPGSIPDLFGQSLGSLQVLDLSFCSIRNAIPSSLGNLTSLIILYLNGNSLAGSVPSSLSQLVLLTVLDFSQNSLTGSIPESFSSLVNLTSFDISSNFLSGSIPTGIGMLVRLQYLNLSSNQLSSSIPVELSDLGNLVDLDLSFNSLSGSVPADLRKLRSLRRMLFGNNAFAGSLPNLFLSTSQLQIVVLKDNGFSGAVPSGLWTVPGLGILDISGNNFTSVLPNSPFDANATTAELNISGNLFYGNLTSILRRFSLADLAGNYFEGTVPDYLPRNGSLVRNCLQHVSNQRSLLECTSFYAERGLTFDNFGLPNSTQPPSESPAKDDDDKNKRRVIILASVLGGVGLIILLLLLLLLLLCIRKRKGTANQREVAAGTVPSGSSTQPPQVAINFSSLGDTFTYQQLLQATGDFNDLNLIKHGHSGDLYKGTLENGIFVVIKRVDLQSVKKEAYLQELDFFSKVLHPRLISLLGHCLEKENEKFLVYKFMPNGDMSSSLYRKTSSEDDSLQSLDWITRLKIATGAAEGLCYLHHECSPPLVHRDVQASSIMLDDKFEVRLGSLSEVCPQEGDTHQSRITRLLRLPQSSEPSTSGSATASCAYDVYCLGKVLLELVTGKLGISSSSEAQLKDWLEQMLPYISIYDKELVTKIVDPSLIIDEDLLEEVWAMTIVARSCLNPKPSRRPPMRYILKALENPLKVVREENSSSARLRTTSSRGSWNAALFGSWRSSSDVAVIPAGSSSKPEGASSFKHSGTSNSQGSGQNGNGGGDHSSSHRRYSREIFPEPADEQDIGRHGQE
ncbi:Leucine-rich repeat protein kinase family protein [Euphorbia peplus]|nr:Leucine-rich repeat protein kinase family protein [Euphorbia peplus]